VHYLTDLLLVKTELLVKILCIFRFIVSFLYYVCFYLRVNKDEYISLQFMCYEQTFIPPTASRISLARQFVDKQVFV